MPVQNYILLLFLLLIICFQQSNAVNPSSSSMGISDTTMNKDKDGNQSGMLQIFRHMDEKLEEMKNKMDEMKRQNDELKEEIMKQNIELKNRMEKMKEELMTELNEMKKDLEKKEEIGGMKEEDTNLKGKTHKEMVNSAEFSHELENISMKDNKLNKADCGPSLKFFGNNVRELSLKHSGPYTGWRTVRAISPISTYKLHNKEPSIASYFEVEILNKRCMFGGAGIVIGFCDKKFPLKDELLGDKENSIGICSKGKMGIDEYDIEFGNDNGYFKEKDFVGIGIIHKLNSKIECFVTWNGQLLKKIELPDKFASAQLFPAVSLESPGDSIFPNFGKHDWRYNEFEHLLQ